MVHKRKRIERNKLSFWISEVWIWDGASHNSDFIQGLTRFWEAQTCPQSICTNPGTGVSPDETGAKLYEHCSNLCQTKPSLSSRVFWFNTSAMSVLISLECFLCSSVGEEMSLCSFVHGTILASPLPGAVGISGPRDYLKVSLTM